MKLNSTRWKIAAFVLIATLLAGCGRVAIQPTPEPTIDTQPTLDIIKTQAVETAVMQMTLSAPTATEPVVFTETATLTPVEPTVAPTFTPIPTIALPTLPPTVVPTLIPTSTYFPVTNTPAASATPSGYSCVVTEQTPPFGYDLPPGGDFDGRWVIKNNGTLDWAATEVDVVFASGTKFQTDVDSFDLPALEKTKTYTVIVDMLAPREAGRYTANWQVKRGSTVLCNLPITIDVVP